MRMTVEEFRTLHAQCTFAGTYQEDLAAAYDGRLYVVQVEGSVRKLVASDGAREAAAASLTWTEIRGRILRSVSSFQTATPLIQQRATVRR